MSGFVTLIICNLYFIQVFHLLFIRSFLTTANDFYYQRFNSLKNLLSLKWLRIIYSCFLVWNTLSNITTKNYYNKRFQNCFSSKNCTTYCIVFIRSHQYEVWFFYNTFLRITTLITTFKCNTMWIIIIFGLVSFFLGSFRRYLFVCINNIVWVIAAYRESEHHCSEINSLKSNEIRI